MNKLNHIAYLTAMEGGGKKEIKEETTDIIKVLMLL